jgi:hypothetical protein
MRTVTCAPILGLCAVALLSQTPPDCKDTVNRTVIDRAMPAVAPTLIAFPAPRPVPDCALCAKLSTTSERRNDANRAAIYRAIRAIGSRIFPGNAPLGGSRMNPVLAHRTWLGSDFRFVVGESVTAAPPCTAPAALVR